MCWQFNCRNIQVTQLCHYLWSHYFGVVSPFAAIPSWEYLRTWSLWWHSNLHHKCIYLLYQSIAHVSTVNRNALALVGDIYIYNPLCTNWPIPNADVPHVIIQYILYFICQKLYWTVSGELSNIGQFQNEATGTPRTRYRRTKAVSMYLMKILSIFLHLRKILICFRIGWFL